LLDARQETLEGGHKVGFIQHHQGVRTQ
jgi:hypothetical protein